MTFIFPVQIFFKGLQLKTVYKQRFVCFKLVNITALSILYQCEVVQSHEQNGVTQ